MCTIQLHAANRQEMAADVQLFLQREIVGEERDNRVYVYEAIAEMSSRMERGGLFGRSTARRPCVFRFQCLRCRGHPASATSLLRQVQIYDQGQSACMWTGVVRAGFIAYH